MISDVFCKLLHNSLRILTLINMEGFTMYNLLLSVFVILLWNFSWLEYLGKLFSPFMLHLENNLPNDANTFRWLDAVDPHGYDYGGVAVEPSLRRKFIWIRGPRGAIVLGAFVGPLNPPIFFELWKYPIVLYHNEHMHCTQHTYVKIVIFPLNPIKQTRTHILEYYPTLYLI